MSNNVQDIYKLIRHSMDSYSTWWSPYDLADLSGRLLDAKAAPYCKYYDYHGSERVNIEIDLLLCLNSDRYLDAYKKEYPDNYFSYCIYDYLGDSYLEATKHPDVLNRIERLFEFFLSKAETPKDYVLVTPFSYHPRYQQRIQIEVARVGQEQFVKSLWSQYGPNAWPIMLSWKAPEYTCRCLNDMETKHYSKLLDIYLEFMTKDDLIRTIISNYQFLSKTGPFWSQVIDLDEMVVAAGFSGVDELFMCIPSGSTESIHRDAQTLALTKALNCPTTFHRLSQLTCEQGQGIRRSNKLPKEIIHRLGWSTLKERRQDLASDMGL